MAGPEQLDHEAMIRGEAFLEGRNTGRTEAAEHILELVRGDRFPGTDAERAAADAIGRSVAQAHSSGFRAGTTIGRAEAEAERPAADFTGETLNSEPSAYDLAVEAMHAAVRLVKPVDLSVITLDRRADAGEQLAAFVADVADELAGWLSEHIPPAPYGEGTPIVDEARWAVADPDTATAVNWCPSCGMSMKHGCSNPQCDAPPELVEDDDGAPLPPEQQPCPECRAGKHLNCPDEIWTDGVGPGGGFIPCPCPDEWHRTAIVDSDATI